MNKSYLLLIIILGTLPACLHSADRLAETPAPFEVATFEVAADHQPEIEHGRTSCARKYCQPSCKKEACIAIGMVTGVLVVLAAIPSGFPCFKYSIENCGSCPKREILDPLWNKKDLTDEESPDLQRITSACGSNVSISVDQTKAFQCCAWGHMNDFWRGINAIQTECRGNGTHAAPGKQSKKAAAESKKNNPKHLFKNQKAFSASRGNKSGR